MRTLVGQKRVAYENTALLVFYTYFIHTLCCDYLQIVVLDSLTDGTAPNKVTMYNYNNGEEV